MPLTSKKKPISAASVVKAACGCTSAQMPAMTKNTPRSPWTIFQPVDETEIAKNSFTPANEGDDPEEDTRSRRRS